MFETIYAQFRFAGSLLFARPFHLPSLNRLVEALLATYHEFGGLTHEAGELVAGPALDEDTRRELQLRRFRHQAVRAARETPYYATLFRQRGTATAAGSESAGAGCAGAGFDPGDPPGRA